jgi:hypothetical protein
VTGYLTIARTFVQSTEAATADPGSGVEPYVENVGNVESPHGSDLTAVEAELWRGAVELRERYGPVGTDDPRPDARVASDAWLALHAEYMAAIIRSS